MISLGQQPRMSGYNSIWLLVRRTYRVEIENNAPRSTKILENMENYCSIHNTQDLTRGLKCPVLKIVILSNPYGKMATTIVSGDPVIV